MAAAAPLVRLSGVELTLESGAGAVNILRGVDLTVSAGDTVAVTGASGSGKSTLMAVIAGLERPTRGRIEVAGRDLGALNEDQLALFRRANVGIVFQSFHLVPTMTALENVAVPMELAGRADAFARAEAALQAAGLGHRLTHYPALLSGGEQQRVAVARAFGNEPKLVLADEPTGNLDSTTGASIVDLMFNTQARVGCTLVLITHDVTVARKCRRHLHMQDGRLMADGAVASGGAPPVYR